MDVDDALRRTLERLTEKVAALEARVAQLTAENTALKAQVADLNSRLGTTSRNSSKPPSSDPPGFTRKPKKKSKRRPGGQPGHKRHERELLPPDEVDEVVAVHPSACEHCGKRLARLDGEAVSCKP